MTERSNSPGTPPQGLINWVYATQGSELKFSINAERLGPLRLDMGKRLTITSS